MKNVFLMSALMLVLVGCSDANEAVAPESTPDVLSNVDEPDVVSGLDVDSEEDVSTLDSEQLSDAEEEAVLPDVDDSSDVEEFVDVNEEDEPPLDEDPTRFGADAFSAAFIPAPFIP